MTLSFEFFCLPPFFTLVSFSVAFLCDGFSRADPMTLLFSVMDCGHHENVVEMKEKYSTTPNFS